MGVTVQRTCRFCAHKWPWPSCIVTDTGKVSPYLPQYRGNHYVFGSYGFQKKQERRSSGEVSERTPPSSPKCVFCLGGQRPNPPPSSAGLDASLSLRSLPTTNGKSTTQTPSDSVPFLCIPAAPGCSGLPTSVLRKPGTGPRPRGLPASFTPLPAHSPPRAGIGFLDPKPILFLLAKNHLMFLHSSQAEVQSSFCGWKGRPVFVILNEP